MPTKNKTQHPSDALFNEVVGSLRMKPDANAYPPLVESLKALAAEGHARAARVLAILHLRGRGVQKSQELGLEWLHRSGELGDVGAQLHLAQRYESGSGVVADEALAFYWTMKAAKNGHLFSQLSVSDYLFKNQTTPNALKQSVYWLRAAAKGGIRLAQYAMGLHYENGYGVPQSDKKAMEWYRLAESNNPSKLDERDTRAILH